MSGEAMLCRDCKTNSLVARRLTSTMRTPLRRAVGRPACEDAHRLRREIVAPKSTARASRHSGAPPVQIETFAGAGNGRHVSFIS
jgi:hypothetical protein